MIFSCGIGRPEEGPSYPDLARFACRLVADFTNRVSKAMPIVVATKVRAISREHNRGGQIRVYPADTLLDTPLDTLLDRLDVLDTDVIASGC